MKAIKILAMMLVALVGMTACSSDDDNETKKLIIDPVEGLQGYIFVSSGFFTNSYYGDAATLDIKNEKDQWVVKFHDPQWGEGVFENVVIDEKGHTLSGTGTVSMTDIHSGNANTYDATISGDVTNPVITVQLGKMGVTTISFYAGEASKAFELNGNYAGTNSVKVGDAYGPYDADVTCKVTPNPDGTLNVTIPEHVLMETAIGNLTLGKVTFEGLYFDETNNRFYREYGKLDKELKMHFKAEGDRMNLDDDYAFTESSEIEVKATEGGIQIINRYQLGRMPFPIVATFEGTIPSAK